VHLHRHRDRGVVAEQHQHLGDRSPALSRLSELRVRQLAAADQRRELVHGALVRISEQVAAGGMASIVSCETRRRSRMCACLT
jgi:hypothetical protein